MLILSCFYILRITTPMYAGRLTIDINNNTWDKIENASIIYSDTDKIFFLPDIAPQERLIIVAPSKVYDIPRKATVFLNYNGKRYILLDEYYSLDNARYNMDTKQMAKAIFNKDEVKIVKSEYAFGLEHVINYKPYFRIIDFDQD